MWESNTVEANGIRLHYTRTGGAKPPLVLAHGITDNGLCWTDVAQVLQADYDVIMVDARGHGLSDAPETGNDWMTLAEDIQGVIQALELQKPIVLGHSMGALTALIFASQYPDVPKAILLEDPPPMWMGASNTRNDGGAGVRNWIRSLAGQNRDDLLAGQRQATPHWTETELTTWADSKMQVSQNVAKIVDSNSDFSDLMPKITCPALLITADPNLGAAVNSETAARLKLLVPQIQIENIADAGHSIHRDKFDDYMRVVQAYLKSL